MPSGDAEQDRELQVHRQESILSFASPPLFSKDASLKPPLCWEDRATAIGSSNASKITPFKVRASSPHCTDNSSPELFKDIFELADLGDLRQKSIRI